MTLRRVENHHFRTLYSDCRFLAEECNLYRWKMHLVCYNYSLLLIIWVCLHSFSRYCPKISEIMRISKKIRTYSSRRSSKVIDLGVTRKRICNLLLVINSDFGRIRISYTVFEISQAAR